MLPLKKIALNKGMTNDAIIAIYFNVSIQSEWSIVNIFVVGKMCHLERSPSHCVVVQVPVCVRLCVAMLNIKTLTNVALLTSNLLYTQVTQNVFWMMFWICRTALFKTRNSCLLGQGSFVSRLSSERASAWKILTNKIVGTRSCGSNVCIPIFKKCTVRLGHVSKLLGPKNIGILL